MRAVLPGLVVLLFAAARCGARRDAKGIEQVWVPAGSFLMGTDDGTIQELKAQKPPAWVMKEFDSERPQHPVRLTEGYWIDKYEVTNAAFRAFVDDGGYKIQAYWSEPGRAWQRLGSTIRTASAIEKPSSANGSAATCRTPGWRRSASMNRAALRDRP